MAHHLLYWRPETVATIRAANAPIRYAASDQLQGRVVPGDTLWLVTTDAGLLQLVGRVEVEAVVGRGDAAERLGSADLWDARSFAIARAGTERPPSSIDISHIAPAIRFRSVRTPALTVSEGGVNAQQLQTMRTLSGDSARLLERIWTGPIWSLRPGDRIRRVELHQQFGGRGQGGIGPSATSPNVFLFTDPRSGEQHGYFDGWGDDGLYHYTGEGQRGDQQFIQGNGAVLEHRRDGRALRLFKGAGGEVEYLGEFEVDSSQTHYTTDAPETAGGPVREVIVFRLRPVGNVVRHSTDTVRTEFADAISEVAVEQQHTERTVVEPSAETFEAERREQQLVLAYKSFLELQGYRVTRHRCCPTGEAKPLYTDLFDATRGHLIEAKGSVTREAVRMAIGQLLDYQRFLSPAPKLAILVPRRPRLDLEELLRSLSIGCIWATEGGFADNHGGAFL